MPAAAVAATATFGGGAGGVVAAIEQTRKQQNADDDGDDSTSTTSVSSSPTAAQATSQSLQSRILAAAGASFVSVVVVNPFDVVKTRMQAASAIRSPAFATGRINSSSNRGVTALGSKAPTTPTTSSSSTSAASVLRSVLRREGWRGLWRGADFALLMSLPMVGVYMPLYDDALAALRSLAPPSPPKEAEEKGEKGENDDANGSLRRLVSSDAVAPALAGGAARAVAVLATSPLELARTRAQAPPEWTTSAVGASSSTAAGKASGSDDGKKQSSSSSSSSSRLLRRRLPAALPQPSGPGVAPAVRAAWTGSAATLARDVPFSALYWALLEPVRSAALRWWPRGETAATATATITTTPTTTTSTASLSSSSSSSPPPPPQPPSAAAVAFANLVSGATAGGAAAALTTPFDVVKTKLQLEAGRQSGGRSGGTGTGAAAATTTTATSSSSSSPSSSSSSSPSVSSTMRSIYSRGGLRALFAGVGPRSARAAPACAIVVASYELLKMVGGGTGGGVGVGGGGALNEKSWRSDERGLALGAEND